MRDDIPTSLFGTSLLGETLLSDRRAAKAVVADRRGRSATVIPFPGTFKSVTGAIADVAPGAALYATVFATLDPKARLHPPTRLAALGAVAGFAAQQALLLAGGSAWAQPLRAERLDCLLLSARPVDASLWSALVVAAHSVGAQHLPDPQKLLASTLKCMGTSQFGQITLPLEYRLEEQPQTSLVRLWARTRAALDAARLAPALWPAVVSAVCADRVAAEHGHVPPHVTLRIIMQAALAMALVEPKLIPGAALRAE